MKRQRREEDFDDGDHRGDCRANPPEKNRLAKRPRVGPGGDTLRFPVDARRCDGPFPNFRQPVEVGSFSQDGNRTFHHDRRQLRYFVRPARADPGFDLREGYSSMIRKDDTVKEYLDDMLRWVIRNPEKFALHSKAQDSATPNTISSLHTDFLCWRGLLTRLLCTPNEHQDDWKIAVTRFRGTLYMCEFETERKCQREAQMTERQKEMAFWGWRFEDYVTAKEPGGRPDSESVVNNNQGFCSVVRTRLLSHSLVYGGEVDCVDENIEGGNKYIELKTSRMMDTQRQRHNFKRFKLLKWWAQSFLLGITKIVGGFRDDDGVVHSVEDFLTHDIPSLIQDVSQGWKANVCFNFLHQLLSFIKQHATVDHPRQVYLLEWSPGRDVTMRDLGTESPLTFLPPWFIHWDGWERTPHHTSTTTTPTPASASAAAAAATTIT